MFGFSSIYIIFEESGLGYVKSISDIENAVVTSEDYTSIRIKDIGKVSLGPATRRGLLDKEGAEVVGAVVVARYGANPMEVINNVKEKINELSAGLPSKVLADGRTSQVTIVPFYDRTELIQETLGTLNEALTLEILITILVIIIMVFNLSGAIVTAVMTTIISFIPVFTMIGAEGKLFRPLAFTKTFALTASIIVALFLIPPFAAFLFRKKNIKSTFKYVLNGVLIAFGIVAIVYGYWIGLILIAFGITALLNLQSKITDKQANLINIIISVSAIVFLLAEYWRPLGVDKSIFWNLIFVSVICFGLLGVFSLFIEQNQL